MITICPAVTDLTSLLNTGEDCSAKENATGTCLESLATMLFTSHSVSPTAEGSMTSAQVRHLRNRSLRHITHRPR